MAGKPNDKWLETMIKKHGSREAVAAFMKENGAKGGRNGKGHAFGHGKVDPVEAGRRGGLVRGESYKRAAETSISEFQIPKTNSKKMFGLWNR